MKQTCCRGYKVLGLVIAAWAAVLVFAAIMIVPDLYWYSYYSVDYTTGFVRRGLGGELLGLFSKQDYFAGLKTLRWFPTVSFTIALAFLVRAIALGSGRAEMRFSLALLVFLMPCGFAFGLFSARPDLFGATALIGFAVAVRSVNSDQSIFVLSGVLGGVMAILALIHEGIPFLFAGGVITALVVLARNRSEMALRASAMIAIGPGLVVATAVSVLGQHGSSAQLCQLIPHGSVNWPASGNLTISDLLRGQRYYIDYHDWICRNITPLFDQTIGNAVESVAQIGFVALTGSTALGITFLILTIFAISRVSNITFKRFLASLGHRGWWLVLSFALFLPIFLTGIDWIRWWLVITFDIAVVYLLFASGEAESEQSVELDLGMILILCTLMLAAPLSAISVFGGNLPV